MENLVLRQGDLVRALRTNDVFERCGLKVGAWYAVTTDTLGRLTLKDQGLTSPVTLTGLDGTLDLVTDDLTRRPREGLPVGQANEACPLVCAVVKTWGNAISN